MQGPFDIFIENINTLISERLVFLCSNVHRDREKKQCRFFYNAVYLVRFVLENTEKMEELEKRD